MADRVIRYKLKLVPDEDNARAAKEFEKSAKASQDRINKAGERARKDRAKGGKEEEKARKDSLTKQEKDFAAWSKRDNARRKKDLAAKKREEAKAAKDAERIARQEAAMKKAIAAKRAQDHAKETAARVAREKKAAAEVDRTMSVARGKIEAGRAQMVEGATSATESFARFGRGFALLAASNEKESRKMLETVVKIQAAFDIVVGGVNAFVRLSKAVRGYRLATEGAAAVETAARAKSLAMIKAEILAENALTAARGRSAAAGVASSTARTGGGAAAGGAALAGGGGAAAGGGALGTAGIVGLFAVAAASVAAAAKVLWESLTGSAKNVDSWSMKIAGAEVWLADKIAGGRLTGRRELEAMEKSVRQEHATRERSRMREGEDFRAQRERFAARRDLAAGVQPDDPRARIAAANRQLALAGGQRRAVAGARAETDVGRAAQRETILEINRAEESLLRERMAAEKEIRADRLATVRESIRGAEQELAIAKQRIQAERDRLKSAKERFGQLSKLEQSQLIGIKRKADRGEELTREERAKLRGIGTAGAEGIASKGDIAAAEAAGFDRFFGGEERRKIQEGERKQRGLEVEIADRRQIEVKIQQDEERVVAEIAAIVERKLRERERLISQRIAEEVDSRLGEVAAMTDEDVLGRSRNAILSGR